MERTANKDAYFRIDGVHYPVNEEETYWAIGKNSHTLVTEIVVSVTDINADIGKGLLSEYNDEGRIRVYVEALGIFNRGIPTGEFEYEGDRDPKTFTYLRKEGLDFGLDFFGIISYENGWVKITGELKRSYDKQSVFPVDAAIPFDPAPLDWSVYRFKSLEETAGADRTQVRLLEITNPDFKELPASIFDFVNLEYFSVVNRRDYWDNTKLPLEKLDERLGELKQLKGISINKAAIDQLPNSVGELQALENLNVCLCELREVPEKVWKLPNLKYLILMDNRITHIPHDIQLPALLTLDVEKNRLTTLPESLLKQPAIKSIKASGNPLESLPERFSFFRGLNLSMAEKKKLLDTTYKGADGKGTIPWDDAVYYAASDDELMAPVVEIIRKNELGKHKKALFSLVKRAVGFHQTAEEDYSEVGNHRFGGMPDLPEDVAYPIFFDEQEKKELHYEFIAQVNCAHLAPLQDYLPRTGSLFFFFKSIHYFGFDDKNIARVIYVEDNSRLSSAKQFTLREEDFLELPGGQYAPFKAEAFATVSAPSFYASSQNEYLFEGKAKSLKDKEELLEELYDTFEEPVNAIRRFDYGLNAYAFTQHESPELQAALSLKGNPRDWITLLLVKSRGDFQWGDAGDLFFVIHKSDLAKKDFSNVFLTMESS